MPVINRGPRSATAVIPLGLGCLVPLLTLLDGCTIAVSFPEFDRLNRSVGIRTLVVEPEFSLYSPYPTDTTGAFARVVDEELSVVAATFGVVIDEPVIVRLVARPASTRQIPMGEATGTLAGWAHATREVVIYVEPSAEVLGPVRMAAHERRVIRHELAHSCLHRLIPDPPQWLDEGVAEEIESRWLVNGRLRAAALPEGLLQARAMERSDRSLTALLAWRGGSEPDPTLRPLAHALVRFLLEHSQAEDFAASLRAMAAIPARNLLALEDEWQRWIDDLNRPQQRFFEASHAPQPSMAPKHGGGGARFHCPGLNR
ncbi:MAG: hypothetical protein AB1486_00590 [Planctomycetota bacterium]